MREWRRRAGRKEQSRSRRRQRRRQQSVHGRRRRPSNPSGRASWAALDSLCANVCRRSGGNCRTE
eukprot:5677797-Pleurochrysis_carterae.AAC.1